MDYTQLILGSLISFGVFAALFAAMIKTPVLTFTSALILCVLMLALPPETLPLDSASWAAPGLFLLAAAVLLSQPKFGQTSIIRVFTHVGLHLLVVYLMVSAAMAESETQSLTMHRPRPVDALPALLWMAAAIVPIHLLRFVSAPTRWGHHLRLGLSLRHAVRLQLPLPDALRASARNHRNAEAGVLNRLARVVEDGGTLSEAIRRWYPPKLYPWIGPLVSAEELHRPSDALEDICRTLRKRAHVPTNRSGWYGLLFLVLFVQFFLVAACLFVLPQYEAIFADLGSVLTGPIAVLHEWIALLAGPVGMAITLTGLLVLLAFGIRLFPGFVAELTWLLELTDRIRWHIPPWRRLQRADQQGRLIRHIRTGIKAGFDLDRILEAAGQLRLNRAYAPRVSRWRSGIARGDDPYEAAIKAGVGRRVAQVFRNQAGSRRLCQIMDAVCEQIQADVEHRLHMIQSIAFPAVVIVVAIPVAMLALWLVAMTTILVQLSM